MNLAGYADSDTRFEVRVECLPIWHEPVIAEHTESISVLGSNSLHLPLSLSDPTLGTGVLGYLPGLVKACRSWSTAYDTLETPFLVTHCVSATL